MNIIFSFVFGQGGVDGSDMIGSGGEVSILNDCWSFIRGDLNNQKFQRK